MDLALLLLALASFVGLVLAWVVLPGTAGTEQPAASAPVATAHAQAAH